MAGVVQARARNALRAGTTAPSTRRKRARDRRKAQTKGARLAGFKEVVIYHKVRTWVYVRWRLWRGDIDALCILGTYCTAFGRVAVSIEDMVRLMNYGQQNARKFARRIYRLSDAGYIEQVRKLRGNSGTLYSLSARGSAVLSDVNSGHAQALEWWQGVKFDPLEAVIMTPERAEQLPKSRMILIPRGTYNDTERAEQIARLRLRRQASPNPEFPHVPGTRLI